MSKLVARTGVRPLVAGGTAVAAVGMLLLGRVSPHSSYLFGVMLPMMLLTAGAGVGLRPATLAAVCGVGEQHSGLVSGVSTTAIQVGGSIGLAILATVAATTTGYQGVSTPVSDALTAGYADAFGIAALVLGLAVPLALGLLRLRPASDRPIEPDQWPPSSSPAKANHRDGA